MKPLIDIYNELYEHYGTQYWWPAQSDIEMMIGSVLVQNTRWENVEMSLNNFPSFNAREILSLNKSDLIELIRPSGFYNRKSETIINLLTWYEKYNFDTSKVEHLSTEELRKELLNIHGIGEETCDSILLYLFERPVFVVDAYLKRLLEKHGHPVFKTYQKIQKYVSELLTEDVYLYQEFHALIVQYGKDGLILKK